MMKSLIQPVVPKKNTPMCLCQLKMSTNEWHYAYSKVRSQKRNFSIKTSHFSPQKKKKKKSYAFGIAFSYYKAVVEEFGSVTKLCQATLYRSWLSMRMNQTYTAPTKKETICVTLNFVREQFHCRGDSIKEYNFGKKKNYIIYKYVFSTKSREVRRNIWRRTHTSILLMILSDTKKEKRKRIFRPYTNKTNNQWSGICYNQWSEICCGKYKYSSY